jgi:type I restriction enzyme, S subunit
LHNNIVSLAKPGTQIYVNTGDITGLDIPIPKSPEEQTAIATVLSDLDSLMEALDKLIAKKRDIKQATMQQLLTGKRRLPSFSGDWEVKTLGEIAEVVMGQSPVGTSYNRDGDGYPLINGPTEFTDKHPIKIQWTNQPTKFCKKDDILLCVRGSSTGRINIANDDYCIGRGIAAIRAKAGVDAKYTTFQVDCAVKTILALTTGSTFPNIDGKSIRSIEVPLPSLSEQCAIAYILSDMDAEITALEQKRDKTRALKLGMMQELLTGKTRLV